MERTKIGLVLAKLETTYGTDAAPTGAANTITVAGLPTYAVEVDIIDRDILDGDLVPIKGSAALPRAKLSFDLELRGNRTDGTAADISKGVIANALDFDCLLQACDLAATYTAESTSGARNGSVGYAPFIPSALGPSLTLYYYTGLKLHKIVGAKGNLKINLKAGQFGKISFDFMGLDGGTTDASLPTPTWYTTLPPVVKASTITLATSTSFGGVLDELTVDLGNNISRRDSANATNGVNDFINVSRSGKATANPESITEASHPFYADLLAGNSVSINCAIGTLSGNGYQLALKAVTRSIQYADRNGTRVQNIQFDLQRTALNTTIGQEFNLAWNSGVLL